MVAIYFNIFEKNEVRLSVWDSTKMEKPKVMLGYLSTKLKRNSEASFKTVTMRTHLDAV